MFPLADLDRRPRRRLRSVVIVGAAIVAPLLFVGVGRSGSVGVAAVSVAARCPWATATAVLGSSPTALAKEVVARMTLAEKLGLVNLAAAGGYENRNTGVPRLCIPALTLQDSPNGIAYGATQVTQLPASLGVAASFDPLLAYRYGQVEGQEARGKGIDVVQGPELNLDRVPESGRAFEAYGEDPVLTAALGVANIEGIQSEGVMADAKHYTAYNQETARLLVNEVVSRRALEELYQPPFQAAVQQAHVASLMCSYGSLNGVNDCSSPFLFQSLSAWGFKGFVRSDLGAVTAPVPAFRAGMSMIKPATVQQLQVAIAHHRLATSRLDDAARRVLSEMFIFHMIEHPPTGQITADVATSAHATFAREAAERSIVLLKDAGNVLPLDAKHVKSVAVIGADAGPATMSVGYGSAHVTAPYVVTPLAGLRTALGRHVTVTYSAGGAASLELPAIPSTVIAVSRKLKSGPEPPEFTGEDPQGISDLEVLRAPAVTRSAATANSPRNGKNWSTWSAVLTPPRSGLYTLSLTQRGDTWLYLDGHLVMSSAGLHGPAPWSATVALVAGHHYSVQLTWFVTNSDAEPRLGWAYQSTAIAAAVRAARAARVAVVFANDFTSEGVDRPSLSLPGDQDALIAAVAAANPRTIVVLNTGGPVLMPWLSKVAAVLEAWYPGQEGGNAVAAVLTGRVDPSGHLPVTFPASATAVPAHTASTWPGNQATISYSEGLDIGYRYDQANHLQPLFPFGFGLSYTTFSIGNASLTSGRHGDTVSVTVRNTGRRAGTAVVQAYLGYPPGAGEPPHQLRAFSTATLAPGRSKVATLKLSKRDFEAYVGGRFVTFGNGYTLAIGQSSANLPLTLSLSAP